MVDSNFLNEIKRRRTFAIISHPITGHNPTLTAIDRPTEFVFQCQERAFKG